MPTGATFLQRARAILGVAGVYAAGLSASACTRTPELAPVAQGRAIYGGSDATDDEQVFALFAVLPGSAGTRLYCTATLIGARTLITAAHCVDGFGIGQTSVRATHALDVSDGLATHEAFDVVERRLHPEWSFEDLSAAYNGRDLALLRLDRSPQVAPRSLGLRRLDDARGTPARLVGYGETAAGNEGRRLQAQTYIDRLPGDRIRFDQSDGRGTCGGDSGGPAFAALDGGEERLIGVASFGDPECTGAGYAARLDRQAEFLHAWFAEMESPRCARDTLCDASCAPPDLDCLCPVNGVCDESCPDQREDPDCKPSCESCVGPGEACSDDAQCPQGQCENGTYCAPTCPLAGAACPLDLACDAASGLCLRPVTQEPPPPQPQRGCTQLPPLPLGALLALSLVAENRRPRRRRKERESAGASDLGAADRRVGRGR